MRRTELKETKEHKDDFVIVERASPGTPKVLRDAPALLSKRRGVRMSKGSRRGGKGKKTAPPSLPPSLEVSPTYFAVFRFQANAVSLLILLLRAMWLLLWARLTKRPIPFGQSVQPSKLSGSSSGLHLDPLLPPDKIPSPGPLRTVGSSETQ